MNTPAKKDYEVADEMIQEAHVKMHDKPLTTSVHKLDETDGTVGDLLLPQEAEMFQNMIESGHPDCF
jgi:hypothetical protein